MSKQSLLIGKRESWIAMGLIHIYLKKYSYKRYYAL